MLPPPKAAKPSALACGASCFARPTRGRARSFVIVGVEEPAVARTSPGGCSQSAWSQIDLSPAQQHRKAISSASRIVRRRGSSLCRSPQICRRWLRARPTLSSLFLVEVMSPPCASAIRHQSALHHEIAGTPATQEGAVQDVEAEWNQNRSRFEDGGVHSGRTGAEAARYYAGRNLAASETAKKPQEVAPR